MRKVTIAIPIYNSSKYLRRCLDSIFIQSIGLDNFEVICVDDCSTDNSINILNEYYNRYPETLKIVKRATNSGAAGAPRNDAIKLARGEYIFFVDSDDYLGKEAVERMYKYAKKNNSDVVLGKYKGVNGRGVPKAAFENGNISNAEILKDSLFYTLAPHKMFKMDTIKNLKIKFIEDIKNAEDQLFVVEFFCNCDTISILAEYECYYLTSHEGEHLSTTYVPPEEYFNIRGKIVKCIKDSKFKDDEYKNKLIAKFLTRTFRYGMNKEFYKSNKLNMIEKTEWLQNYSDYLNNFVPHEVDKYVTKEFYLRLKAIRDNDMLKVILAEEINDLKKVISVKDKKISSLEENIKDLDLKILRYENKNNKRKKLLSLISK